MQRILIIGSPGAGKSTVAARLADQLGLPLTHLDKEYWLPGWVEPDNEDFHRRVEEIVNRPRWILDGCYSSTFDLRFPRADTILHLDYSRWLCMYRCAKRIVVNIGRVRSDSAEGCPEQFDIEFIKYVWNFRRTRRSNILRWIAGLREGQGAITFTRPRELETWLKGLQKETPLPRRFEDKSIIVASHNEGKVREIRELLAPFGIETLSAKDLGLAEPEETGTTYEANAELKAVAAATEAGKPALADDSGLAVTALGGDPGIYSARWAGSPRDFGAAMKKVEEDLVRQGADGPDERQARFICALCLAWPDGHTETFLGTVDGVIVWPPRGDKGFGYDPIFLPEGEVETFGEMAQDRKHAMSHRANAFRQLITACFQLKAV